MGVKNYKKEDDSEVMIYLVFLAIMLNRIIK